MRDVFALSIALILSAAVPAFSEVQEAATPPPAATEGATPAEKPKAKTQAERLDRLFSELKKERNEKAAERIAARIWDEWGHSGSASIDLMMEWSQTAMTDRKFDVALDFLDQVVTIRPTYAEGWNRRATVHYMMRNYSKSMADIGETLRLEPRHFGALSGMAAMLEATGRKERALHAYERVLEIYPMMRSAQGQVATLSEELAGEGI
jgi:tetratricopeptide (TPR) repeat protein